MSISVKKGLQVTTRSDLQNLVTHVVLTQTSPFNRKTIASQVCNEILPVNNSNDIYQIVLNEKLIQETVSDTLMSLLRSNYITPCHSCSSEYYYTLTM